jgi:hypothetical protein
MLLFYVTNDSEDMSEDKRRERRAATVSGHRRPRRGTGGKVSASEKESDRVKQKSECERNDTSSRLLNVCGKVREYKRKDELVCERRYADEKSHREIQGTAFEASLYGNKLQTRTFPLSLFFVVTYTLEYNSSRAKEKPKRTKNTSVSESCFVFVYMHVCVGFPTRTSKAGTSAN